MGDRSVLTEMPRLTVASVVPGGGLAEDELACWSALQQANESLASPFFSPAFTSIVAAARNDVSVALLNEGEQLRGFFPFQRGRLGVGRPVGSILSDYQGAIVADDARWDAKALIRACGLNTWEFEHVVASQRPLSSFRHGTHESLRIDVSNSFDRYLSELRLHHGDSFRHLQRMMRKFEREHGELRFVPHSDDPEILATLLAWKSAQYKRTGAADILQREWVCEVLGRVHRCQSTDFAGVLSTIGTATRPVAIHLGLRSPSVLHSWFAAYDPAFAKYSPGLIVLLKIAEGAQESRIRTIDLGYGDYGFKRLLTTHTVALMQGSVETPSLAATATRARRALRSVIRSTGVAPSARRLARRMGSR